MRTCPRYIRMYFLVTGDLAQWLCMLAALAEDTGPVLSTNMVAQNHLQNSISRDLDTPLSPWILGLYMVCVQVCGEIHTELVHTESEASLDGSSVDIHLHRAPIPCLLHSVSVSQESQP